MKSTCFDTRVRTSALLPSIPFFNRTQSIRFFFTPVVENRLSIFVFVTYAGVGGVSSGLEGGRRDEAATISDGRRYVRPRRDFDRDRRGALEEREGRLAFREVRIMRAAVRGGGCLGLWTSSNTCSILFGDNLNLGSLPAMQLASKRHAMRLASCQN